MRAGIAAGPPVRKLAFVETLGHASPHHCCSSFVPETSRRCLLDKSDYHVEVGEVRRAAGEKGRRPPAVRAIPFFARQYAGRQDRSLVCPRRIEDRAPT